MWYFGNKRIYVQTIEDSQKQIVAQLQPLAGGTVYQFFGYESPKLKLSGLVVGGDNAYHLRTLTASGVAYTLQTPEGSFGNYIPEGVKVSRLPTVYQTIDTDQDCLTAVYSVEMELLKE